MTNYIQALHKKVCKLPLGTAHL